MCVLVELSNETAEIIVFEVTREYSLREFANLYTAIRNRAAELAKKTRTNFLVRSRDEQLQKPG